MTANDIRTLLVERKLYATFDDRLDDDSPLSLDSLSLLWFLAGVEERFGFKVTPEPEDLQHFTCVRRIHAYLVQVRAAASGREPAQA